MVLFCAEAGLTCHPGLDPGSIPESVGSGLKHGLRIESAMTVKEEF